MPLGIMRGAGASSKPSYPIRRSHSAFKDDSAVAGRVRVAVRLRPRNAEEVATDADFSDCVELQSELRRLKLRKNNWNSETFQFDEVFTETASQKRVYEVVAKPVVESVLNGYNGTVMAYGQTGTGKTFTLGQLGAKDPADRGIIVRALEDILANMNPALDIVTVSYLQLYLETVQDLLAPEKDNIPIVEDPKSGDVSLPGATVVQVHDRKDFVQLLQTGEANRFAANTKLNTESSRSHAILLIYIKKSATEKKENEFPLLNKNGSSLQLSKNLSVPAIRKSKLLIVDLAGSERIDKSGSDGHTLEEAKSINLSLTALGKCINALAENSSHIPVRDSKLTRLLRDSFGGTARTSLVVTVGPLPQHQGETASTIMFGQRAMKVENMLKLREEFDYKSLCRKLESRVDILIAQNENASKLALDTKQDLEKKLEESQRSLLEVEKKLATSFEDKVQAEKQMHQHELGTISQLHQQEILEIRDKLEAECSENETLKRELFEAKQSLYEQNKRIKNEELQAEKQMHQDELGTITQLHKQEILEIRDKLEAECSENETLKRELFEAKQSLYEQTEKIHVLEQEIKRHKKECTDMEEMYRDEVSEMKQKIDAEHAKCEHQQEKLKALEKTISEQDKKIEARDQTEIVELRKKLEEQIYHQRNLEKKLRALQSEKAEASVSKEKCHEEIKNMRKKLEEEQKRNGMLEDEVDILKEQILHLSCDLNENTNSARKGNSGKFSIVSESPMTFSKSIQIRETISCQRATIAKLFGEVGLPKIVSYMELEDKDVQIHAVKVVANLAAEESNQEKIVEAGGLSSLLMLLETSEDETIQRVAAGAVANLAMNGVDYDAGGVKLLAKIANKAEDPQTLQMVGGALANLCGNEKLQLRLRDEGGIKALMGMVQLGHSDVLAQVARGVANFAKCESRGATQGHRKGRSFLIDDGALPWIVANSNNEAIPVTRHVELALCHLSSHEANAKDIVSFGAFWELVRISRECSREDIRNLAKRAINTSPTFQMELRRVHFPRG